MFIISEQRKKILIIIIAIILFLSGLFIGYKLFSPPKEAEANYGKFAASDKDVLTVTNTHQVRPKTSLTSPDVIIKQPEVVVQLPNNR